MQAFFKIFLPRMKKAVYIVAILAVMALPGSTWAWGKMGHGLVAEVAFNMLDENTKSKVQKYLADMSVEQAANWMDEIKNDHRNDYMKPWHYVNISEGKMYEETKEENVINQLTRVINELQHKDKMSDEEVRKDLLILLHLVGDMHQPLHVGYGEDKGGNTMQVIYDGHNTNLHKVWDSEIIEKEHISLSSCLASGKHFDNADLAMLSAIDVAKWMRQPRSQLKSVYNIKDRIIDEEYVARNKKVIEEDIFIAGVRLAAVLKDVFKS